MGTYERFVSGRYLLSGQRKSLVSAITFIAVAGVAVGVAALVLVIGVMDGAEKFLFTKILEIQPHARIESRFAESLADPAEIMSVLAEMPEVEAAAPVVEEDVLFSGALGQSTELFAGRLLGVDDPADSRLFPLTTSDGEAPPKLGLHEVMIGAPLAEMLDVQPGDKILAITGIGSSSAVRRFAGRRLIVGGIYETNYYEFDSKIAFISTETARAIFGPGALPDYIHVKLHDPLEVAAFRDKVSRRLKPSLGVLTWEDINGGFFQSIKLQKAALFLILMLTIVVAGFNTISTLIIMVIDKTREIGIMKAFGSSNAMIRQTFFNSGLMIGVIGTVSGVLLGLFGCFLLQYVFRLEMPPSVYNFDRLPVLVKPLTVAVIVVSAMFVCLLSVLFPAIQAARLDPVEALRHE